jgi:Major Facilitator Superfamily
MATDTVTSRGARGVTYRELFAVREYKALWAAQLLSILGDQFARVALTVLVYQRTRSPLLAAVTFAASVLPMLAGGLLLGWMADVWPRRTVMITCDLLSLALVGMMLISGMPLPALVLLLVALAVVSEPFRAARAATNREVLGGRLFPAGLSVTQATYQVGQIAGYAAGGVTVALAGVRGSLLIDAATFAASAAVIRIWVTRRQPESQDRPRVLDGARVILAARIALLALFLDVLLSFAVAPEGVAVPLAAALGHGPAAAGALLAAMTAGAAAGYIIGGRVQPALLARYAAVLAGAGPALLIIFAIRPGVLPGMAILFASGACCGYTAATGSVFAGAIRNADRGKAFGAANAAMVGGQGIVIVTAGALATAIGPALALAACGAAGAVLAVPLGLAWRNR